MAVVNLKSAFITNRDAIPKVLTDALVAGGRVKNASGFVTTGAADSAASVYRFLQVPSNARVSSLVIQSAALGGAAAIDVGVYYPTYIPVGSGLAATLASTAISAAFFASAVAVSAAVVPTEIVNESGTNTIAKQEQPLWQALGLTADPGISLDICGTLTVATAAAADIGVKASYVD